MGVKIDIESLRFGRGATAQAKRQHTHNADAGALREGQHITRADVAARFGGALAVDADGTGLDQLGGKGNVVMITGVQGTGLLFSCELAPDFKCYGTQSTEEYMREHGVGVIHGGVNSLRFTPYFNVRSDEVDLVVEAVRQALTQGPRLSQPAAQAAITLKRSCRP